LTVIIIQREQKHDLMVIEKASKTCFLKKSAKSRKLPVA